MKKIAVIGKNSYIGDSFVRFCKNDYMIDVIESLNDEWKLVNLSGYDTVYHVAGIAHVSSDPNMEELYFKINRDLAIEVANTCKAVGVKQFIFMSSMIIYGKDGKVGKKKTITEKTQYAPVDFYGKSKLDADLAIQKMQNEGFKTVIIRTPIVYGPNCKGNFPKLLNISNKTPIFPYIKNERSMIYIDNLLEFIRLTIENEVSGVFYPQNTEYVSTSDVVKRARILQSKKIWCTRLFYPFIWILSKFSDIVNKIFGNKVYDKSLSQTFDNQYNLVSFEESIKRCIGE